MQVTFMKLVSDVPVGGTFLYDQGDGPKVYLRVSRDPGAGLVAIARLADGGYYDIIDATSVVVVVLKVVPA